MNHQHEQPQNEDENISFDFWKTNYSGRLEKSMHWHDSPLQQDLFEGINRNENELWKLEGFDKSANRRLQNKMNSKRAREKKKNEFEDMRRRIQNLQIENRNLKQNRLCRWCRKSLDHFPTHSIEIQSPPQISQKNISAEKELVFEQIRPPPPKRQWNGKIWIALGILMMVIGLQIHGFTGSDEKSVTFCAKEAKQWAEKYESDKMEGFKVRMKTRGSGDIENEKQKYSKSWEGNKVKQKENWLNLIEFESEERFSTRREDEQVTEFNIDRDLLFSIQAEFDDIGRYI